MKRLFLIAILLCLSCSKENVPSISSEQGFSINVFDGGKIETKKDIAVQDQAKTEETQTEDSQQEQQSSDLTVEDSEQEDTLTGDSVLEELVEVEDTVTVCIDEDGDGYGQDCELGEDCDDMNPNFNVSCPDCSQPGTPGCACKTGAKSVSCYSGDPSWVGKGLCAKGAHQCMIGYWSECIGDILPSPEVCDNKDNDCDGQTDEGVKSTCGTCDMSCFQKSVGGPENPFNLNTENSTGVGLDPTGAIVIDSKQISLNLKFIWIANSPQNTVSKVDCKTITEVGRYQVCSDPSRTSVDLDGNVWVGCRGDGSVAKIIADKKNCLDKNGNGVIDTSSGSLTIPNDECIKFIVNPDGSTIARGAAVDKFNHVWIGFWNTSNLRRLEPTVGNTVDTINISCNPYGLVIDQQGVIWAQGAGCGQLIRVDPTTKQVNKFSYPAGAYGLNVDNKGRVWVASGNSASVFDPKILQWKVVSMNWGGGRGVATSNDGFVYVAVDGSGGAVKIDGNVDPPVVSGFIKGAGNPVGVALDYDGFVWVVNQGGSSTTKMDPKTMAAVGTVSVGSSPYTYSDMTGYTLNYFTAPKGEYDTVFFATGNGNPITQNSTKVLWQSLTIQGQFPTGTYVSVQAKSADTKDNLESSKWVALAKVDASTQMPLDLTGQNFIGLMLQIQINLVTDDKKISPSLTGISAKAKLM